MILVKTVFVKRDEWACTISTLYRSWRSMRVSSSEMMGPWCHVGIEEARAENERSGSRNLILAEVCASLVFRVLEELCLEARRRAMYCATLSWASGLVGAIGQSAIPVC